MLRTSSPSLPLRRPVPQRPLPVPHQASTAARSARSAADSRSQKAAEAGPRFRGLPSIQIRLAALPGQWRAVRAIRLHHLPQDGGLGFVNRVLISTSSFARRLALRPPASGSGPANRGQARRAGSWRTVPARREEVRGRGRGRIPGSSARRTVGGQSESVLSLASRCAADHGARTDTFRRGCAAKLAEKAGAQQGHSEYCRPLDGHQ